MSAVLDERKLSREAREILKKAQAGDLDSQSVIGSWLASGTNTEKNAQVACFWFRKAAIRGHRKAQYNLAVMLINGDGIEKDDKEACTWLRSSAEQGWHEAQYQLGIMLAEGRGIEKDEEEALKWLEKAKTQGNKDAADILSDLAISNETKTSRGYREKLKQAQAGDLEAQNQIGGWLAIGHNVEKNPKQACFWLRKAANRGHRQAQYNLAVMIINGEGTDQDDAEGCKWLQSSAEQEYPEAEYFLGIMYAEGRGVVKSETEARKWYSRAAAKDLPAAKKALMDSIKAELAPKYFPDLFGQNADDVRQKIAEMENEETDDSAALDSETAEPDEESDECKLADRLASGHDIDQDEKRACQIYRRIAGNGTKNSLHAQCKLGIMLADGRGTEKNEREACRRFRQAADKGHAEAQFCLAVMLEHGRGVALDKKEAAEWYEKAAQQGYTKTQQLKELVSLAPSVIRETIANPTPMTVHKSMLTPTDVVRKPPAPMPARERSVTVGARISAFEKQKPDQAAPLSPSSIQSIKEEFQQQLSQYETNLERRLQEMMKKIRTERSSGGAKSEQQVIMATLRQLQDQQETMGQLDSKAIEEELSILNRNAERMQHEMDELRAKASIDPSARAQLSALKREVEPLLVEFRERQILLEQQKIIQQFPPLKTFYEHLQKKLNQTFLAYMSISSGKVDRSGDATNIAINILGESLKVFTSSIASVFTGIINTVHNRKEKKKIDVVTEGYNFLIGATSSEAFVERVARQLTFRYRDQINQTTLPGEEGWVDKAKDKITISHSARGGAQTLAECAVARMIYALNDGKINKEKPLEPQLVDFVFLDTKKYGVLPLFNKTIQTINKKTESWTDKGVFRHSGIQIGEKLFAGTKDCCHEPHIYGYRMGTEEEVDTLKLVVAQKAPVLTTKSTTVSPASGKYIVEVSDEFKRNRERGELQQQHQANLEQNNARLKQELTDLKVQQERDRAKHESLEQEVEKLKQLVVQATSGNGIVKTQLTINTHPSKVQTLTATATAVSTTESSPKTVLLSREAQAATSLARPTSSSVSMSKPPLPQRPPKPLASSDKLQSKTSLTDKVVADSNPLPKSVRSSVSDKIAAFNRSGDGQKEQIVTPKTTARFTA